MIDEKDKLIIKSLDYDSRISVNQISKKTNMKKDTINFRLKKLEREKIIEKYYCVIDYYKLGFSSYKLYIKISSNSKDDIIEFLSKIKEVKFISYIFFDYDLVVFFNSKNELEFYNIYNSILEKFSKDILKREIFEVFEQYYFSQPIYENSKKVKIEKTNLIVKIDDIQKKILNELSLNGNMKFSEISSKINKNSSTLIYSLRSLKTKKVLIGIRPRISYSKLRKIHFIVWVYLNKNEADVVKYLTKQNKIIYISKGISTFDIEFEMVLNSQNELNDFLKKLRDRFLDEIKDFKVLEVQKVVALNYSNN